MPSRAEPVVYPDDHGVYGVPGDVSPWDIRFEPSNRAFLDRESTGETRWRVWTEPGLSAAMVVVRTDGAVYGYRMTRVCDTQRFTFWEALAGPWKEEQAIEYSFAFRDSLGRPVYLAPSGVTNAIERLDRWALGSLEPMSVPAWARGAIIYQIFPDRFERRGTDGESLDFWGSPPSRTGFQGGDLAGVESRLGYLESIGVDAIYLNPIFTSPSNHRYDTVDYYNVDPLLGGNAALRSLVEAAGERSIRVILDASFNHVHPHFFAFKDVMENGPASEFWSWFNVGEWPLRIRHRQRSNESLAQLERWQSLGIEVEKVASPGPPVEPTYDTWYGVPTMPRVDLANNEARSYMLEVAAFWAREFGVDGWRMDVARYVDSDFWDDFREAVREVRSDAFLICEVMGDASPWVQGGQFDSTMNYTFRQICIRFFAKEEIGGVEFLDMACRLWAQYPWPVSLANHNLLGSHDTPRFLTEAGGEPWRLELATIFQMTFPGAPGIYYGDEFEMEGGDDPGCRGAVDWTGPDTGMSRVIPELAELRRKERALRLGEFRPVAAGDGLVAFAREAESRRIVVAINRGSLPAGFRLDVPTSSLVWGSGEVEGGECIVQERSAVILAT